MQPSPPQILIPAAIRERALRCPHRLLFATLSGAHLYGFASADSDWDVRGCHSTDPLALLALSPPRETFELMAREDGLDFDVVTHEVAKYFKMLLSGNGYVLEQIYSPLVVYDSGLLAELREAARLCISRRSRHHFEHFGLGQWRAAVASPKPTVKALLYSYRPLLAGINLMKSGEVVSDLGRLLDVVPVDGLADLVARKRAGDEKGLILPGELAAHDARIQRLCLDLDAARSASDLPEEPGARPVLEDLLRRVRAADFRAVTGAALQV